MPFLKLEADMIGDRHILALNDRQFRLWIGLLCLAKQNDPQGVVAWKDGHAPEPEDLIRMIGLTPPPFFNQGDGEEPPDFAEMVEDDLEHLDLIGIIVYKDIPIAGRKFPAHTLSIKNWKKHQSAPTYNPEYWKDRKREERKGKRHTTSGQPPDTVGQSLENRVGDVKTLRRRDVETTTTTTTTSTSTEAARPKSAAPRDTVSGQPPDTVGQSLENRVGDVETLRRRDVETTTTSTEAARPKSAAPRDTVDQQIVQAFCNLKGFGPAERNLLFKRCARSAKLLRVAAGGDIAWVTRGMTEIAAWLDRQGFTTWTLDALVKHWPQWRADVEAGRVFGADRAPRVARPEPVRDYSGVPEGLTT